MKLCGLPFPAQSSALPPCQDPVWALVLLSVLLTFSYKWNTTLRTNKSAFICQSLNNLFGNNYRFTGSYQDVEKNLVNTDNYIFCFIVPYKNKEIDFGTICAYEYSAMPFITNPEFSQTLTNIEKRSTKYINLFNATFL